MSTGYTTTVLGPTSKHSL